MYTLLYFSPTGNARHVAKLLAGHLNSYGVNMLPLETVRPDRLTENDHLVLLYPIHGFNAPRNVKRFVRDLPPNKYSAVSLIAVGCTEHWVNQAVSLDLRRLLGKKGYDIVLDEVLAMPLTFVTTFPDELACKLVSESETRTRDVAASLISETRTVPDPSLRARLVNLLGKVESHAARLFGLELYANEDCVSCGKCWNSCPNSNIRRSDEGKPQFKLDCMMCMRCIYDCPEQAIGPRFSKFLPIKNGYSLSRYVDC